jgi:hypothetical protein
MHGSCCIVPAMVIVALASPLSIGRAQSPAGSQLQRVLMLRSGRLVSGHITESSGGYVVSKPKGQLVVPFERVRFVARTPQDAYRQMAESIPDGTASSHAELAHWCLSYRLYEEAKAELRIALSIDPNSRKSRRVLRRLENVLHPDRSGTQQASQRAARTRDGSEAPDLESLAALSRGSAHSFMTRVQPILLHSCGNAHCHGTASQNEFRLKHVRIGRGSHRVSAERNLAATLRFIDVKRPEKSRLLTALKGAHGGSHRAIFHGNSGARQAAMLREWTLRTARERADVAELDILQRPFAGTNDAIGEPVSTVPEGNRRGAAAADNPPNRNRGAEQEDILEAVSREERDDKFDPEKFNRAVNGKRPSTTPVAN